MPARLDIVTKYITENERVFADSLISGLSVKESFILAYPEKVGLKPASITSAASKLKAKPTIQKYIIEMQESLRKRSMLDFEEKREILASIAMDGESAERDRIAAIKADNEMVGDVAAKKVDVTHDAGDKMLSLIEKVRSQGMITVKEEAPVGVIELEDVKEAEDE